MPALRVLGRRWRVADDDMPLVSFFALLFHFVREYRHVILRSRSLFTLVVVFLV